MKNKRLYFFLVLPILGLLLYGVYRLPPVYERLGWRVDNLRTRIAYAINPPQEAVFVPGDAVDTIVQATLQALQLSASPAPSLTPTITLNPETATPQPSPTFTLTPTAIPDSVYLPGVIHEYQRWNNCGPATLSMALSFWGWAGSQYDTAGYLKPDQEDKNVSPGEMAAYVGQFTTLRTVIRPGGDILLLKRLIAAGFPVMVEKGFWGPGFDGWMGHYELLTGYNDEEGAFFAEDSYRGPMYPVAYDDLYNDGLSVNFLFLKITRPETEAELMHVLGSWEDERWAVQHALETAQEELGVLDGRPLYFAWFNMGTNYLALEQYDAAGLAYNAAFALYAELPTDDEDPNARPWRMMWYQFGPYETYYTLARYEDVVSLANTTMKVMLHPNLEESFYWRGKARVALGDIEGARRDFTRAIELNPNYTLAQVELDALGAEN